MNIVPLLSIAVGDTNNRARFKFAGFQILISGVVVSSLTILYHHVFISHPDWIFICNL